MDARRTDTPGALLERIAAAAAAGGSAVPAGRMTLFLWGPPEFGDDPTTLADVGITTGSTVRVVVDWTPQPDRHPRSRRILAVSSYESSTDGDFGSDRSSDDSLSLQVAPYA